MATKNPRVSVMLKPSSNAILDRLCAVSGQSKSGLIAEFLEDTCMPMFERMVIVLEAANTVTDEAKAAARQGFQDAEDKLMEVAGLTSDMFDSAARPILQEAERIKRRASTSRVARAGRAATRAGDPAPEARPPHVTRGSGTPNTVTRVSSSPMKTGFESDSESSADLKSKCVCKITTRGERVDNPSCPVHRVIPAKASKRPATPSKPKTKG